MTYLIWTIINLMIVLFFFYLIIGFLMKGKKIFHPQFKGLSIFIVILGIVQILFATRSEKNANRITVAKDFDGKNYSEIKQVVLEENWTFDVIMLVGYSTEKKQYNLFERNSFLTGFVRGFRWEAKSIATESLNGKTAFTVNGVLEWHLFGISVYSESKTFNGII